MCGEPRLQRVDLRDDASGMGGCAQGALRPVKVAKTGELQVGQSVYAIGNPFGLDHTLTMGIISGESLRTRPGSPRPRLAPPAFALIATASSPPLVACASAHAEGEAVAPQGWGVRSTRPSRGGQSRT